MAVESLDTRLEYELDIRTLLARVLARPWLVLSTTALCSAGFWLAALLLTPTYRVTTVLAPANTSSDAGMLAVGGGALGSLASMAGISLGPTNAETEEALAVLRSREFTENFIISKHLMPKFFPRKWDSTKQAWKVDQEHQPTLAMAYKYFDKKVRAILEDKKTGLITLQIDWKNRAEAAEWANELVTRLNAEMRERAIAKANASMQFLERELQTTSTVEVREAITRLMEAQEKDRMLANVTQDYSLRVVDRAIASDMDEPVWPPKKLFFAAGPLLGLLLGGLCALSLDYRTGDDR